MDDSSDSSAFICTFNIDKSGNLISTGSTELKNTLDVDGLTTLKGGLTIGGIDTNIDSNMTVKKKSIFKENVNIEGNLNVKESVYFYHHKKY